MKIKKSQLKQIIQEELNIVMHEADEGEEMMDALENIPSAAEDLVDDILDKIGDMAGDNEELIPSLSQAVAALLAAD